MRRSIAGWVAMQAQQREAYLLASTIRSFGNERPGVAISAIQLLGMMPWKRFPLILGTIAINMLALALPLVILQVYDRVIPHQATGTLTLLLIGVTVALVLDAVLRFARSEIVSYAGARFVHFMKCDAVGHMLRTPVNVYERDEAGVHIERLSALDSLREQHTGQAMVALIDLPFAILFLSLIGWIGGPLIFVPIAIFVIFSCVAYGIAAELRKSVQSRSLGEDRRIAFVVEVLTGIHTVKGLAMEALMARRYERLIEGNAGPSLDAMRLSSRAQETGAFAAQFTILAVAAFGSLLVMAGDLTVGGLVACTLLAGRSLQPLLRGIGLWTQLQNLAVSASQTARIFAMPAQPATNELRVLPTVEGNLTMDMVSFRYDGAVNSMIKDVNLELAKGEIAGIAGDSGAGKSTLLWIMAGLSKPTSGRVLYDDINIGVCEPASVRRASAYIPQRAVLFRGTVMDNLTGFRKGEAADRAVELSEQIGLDQKIAWLPDGYDTLLDDTHSSAMPAGLQQQIAIVRALIDQPSIVLFDEANATLDQRDDIRLRNLLREYSEHGTIVLVSHRPSTLAIADRRFVLEDGRLEPRAAVPGAPS